MNKKGGILYCNALYTLIAIVMGFAVGAILLLAAGIDPGLAYSTLVGGIFSKPKFMTWCVVYASPLIFTGLSVAFSFRTGVFNIGAEGQFVMGSLAACLVGIFVPAPGPILVILCIVAAAAAGGDDSVRVR